MTSRHSCSRCEPGIHSGRERSIPVGVRSPPGATSVTSPSWRRRPTRSWQTWMITEGARASQVGERVDENAAPTCAGAQLSISRCCPFWLRTSTSSRSAPTAQTRLRRGSDHHRPRADAMAGQSWPIQRPSTVARLEAELVFGAGAQWMTVLAGAPHADATSSGRGGSGPWP